MRNNVKIDFFSEMPENKKMDVDGLLNSLSNAPGLMHWPMEKIIDILGEFSKKLLDKSNTIHQKYPNSGIAYIAGWCRKNNLIHLLKNSFGCVHALDTYNIRVSGDAKSYQAFPRGLIVHWMAGNVPTLGFLSLIQGLLTKNKNIIKAPSLSDTLLADLLNILSETGNGKEFSGKKLTRSIAVIRYEQSLKHIGELLSRHADVRVFWGSDQSISAIKSLPSKLSATDIVFSNKTSFMAIDKHTLENENLQKIAKQAASDISIFEQKACASPHTLFLETTEESKLNQFASLLAQALKDLLTTIPKITPTSSESSAILNLRAQYDMFYKAWYSEGMEFTILSDNEIKLGPPIGNRTLFIRKTDNLEKIANIIPENIQTVGLFAEHSRFEKLTALFATKGVQRFAKIGTMTHFDIPWDGYFLPHYLVRWVSRQ